MKIKTIIGFIIIVIGILSALYFMNIPVNSNNMGVGQILASIGISLPLIIIGILFIFSIIGAIISFVAMMITLLPMIFIMPFYGLSIVLPISIGLFIVGIIYGIIEKIKFNKNKK